MPSNRNRTVFDCLPWRSQNASMSFFNGVVFFILKKTSLFPSVTFILRCSVGGGGSGLPFPIGDCSFSDILIKRRLATVDEMAGFVCAISASRQKAESEWRGVSDQESE